MNPTCISLKRFVCALMLMGFFSFLGVRSVRAIDLVVSVESKDVINVYDLASGRLKYTLGSTADNIDGPDGMALGNDGLLYVASRLSDKILRYNLLTHSKVDTYASISSPYDVSFDAAGNLLALQTTQVKRYNPGTGTFSNVLVGTTPAFAYKMAYDGAGYLYLADFNQHNIKKYDAAGNYVTSLASLATPYSPQSASSGLAFGPDGNLYIPDFYNSLILEFNGNTGAFIRTLPTGAELKNPTRMRFGPDGNLYVISQGNSNIVEYQGPYGASPGSMVRVVTTVSGTAYDLLFVGTNTADFNSDGNPDLIWQNNVTGEVVTWFMNGVQFQGNAASLGGASTEWKVAGVGDLNGDGSPDLIWLNQNTGDVSYWLMNGTTRIGADYLAHGVPTEWKIVSVADMNGDGRPDLIWQNQNTGDVSFWQMNGITRINADYIARNVPTAWKIVGTGDFNGDGKNDLVWQNTQTGDSVVWYMNGFVWPGNYDYLAHGIPTDWKIAAIADFNGDGYPDLIWSNRSTGDVSYWLMSGITRAASDYIYHGVPLQWSIAGRH